MRQPYIVQQPEPVYRNVPVPVRAVAYTSPAVVPAPAVAYAAPVPALAYAAPAPAVAYAAHAPAVAYAAPAYHL